MVKLKKYTITGSRDRNILADLHYSESNQGLVIFCHGYKGYKDWGAWHLVAQEFAKHNLAFLKFNFSFNGGTIENPIDFPDLEAFAKNNYSTELNDLNAVIAFVQETAELSQWSSQFLGLIGHSRGGGIAILGAQENNVDGLSTWASVADYARRFPTHLDLENWQQRGVYYVKNGRTHQDMPHYYQFYQDFQVNSRRLNILQSAEKIKAPWLILHGEKDKAVDISEAIELFNASTSSLFITSKEADHTFGAYHPFKEEKMPLELQEICDQTIAFFKV